MVLTGMSLLSIGLRLVNERLGDVHAERQGPGGGRHTVKVLFIGYSPVEQGLLTEQCFPQLPLFMLI